MSDTRVTEILEPDPSTPVKVPLFTTPVAAGFPSPAEDYIESRLDLNKYLIKHPAATFFVRVAGDSMRDAGIHPGDILVVDRSLEPKDRDVVVAVVNGDFTVKRIRRSQQNLFLVAENPDYEPMSIVEGMEFEVWGVVTASVHRF